MLYGFNEIGEVARELCGLTDWVIEKERQIGVISIIWNT